MKCANCGIEGIHACLGKPLVQEDMPEGVFLVDNIAAKVKPYCKECGGFIDYDKSKVLASHPPKFMGICSSCGDISYEFCIKVQ